MNAIPSIRQNGIAPGMSLYLDLIRFVAAVMVMVGHTWHWFDPASTTKFPGHEAVVVFFVLSGFVIAHAAMRPGVTLGVYVQHRVARIVPVAWVALLLAGLLALTVPALNDEPGLLPHTLANLVFMGQSGWSWMEAPLNSPYWSLNYEVWYYAIFGAWLFVRRHRWLWLGVALLLAGPKILMLMPVWLMGVALYHRMPAFSKGMALVIFVATAALTFAMFWMDLSEHSRAWLYRVAPPFWRAHYSSQFLYDIVLGVVVTFNFAAVASLAPTFNALSAIERPIRYLASFTLSLYVFHAPLTELLVKVVKIDHAVVFYGVLAVCVFVLAQLTERRTGWYRQQLRRVWNAKRTAPVGVGQKHM